MKRVALAIVLLGIPVRLAAAQDAEAQFPLRRVLDRVLRLNPDLLAEEQRYGAARARLLTQRPLLQDPVFTAEHEGLSTPLGFGGFEERTIGVVQPVEFPVKWWMRNDIAGKEARVAEMEFELARLAKLTEARKTYAEALARQRQRELAYDNLSLAQDFLRKAKVRFEAGDVPRIEVLRAEIEVAKAERDTMQAGKDLLLAKADLNLLMARDAHAPLELTDELAFRPVTLDIDSLKALMLEKHPRARALEYAVAGTRSAARLSALQFLPDLELGIFRRTIRGQGASWLAEVGFEVPLWFMFRQRGELQEARANVAQARAQQSSVRNSLILELERAYHELHIAEKQVRIYTEKLLKEAEEVYRIASRSYEEGEASYIEVLEAQRLLRTTRAEYVQALFEYYSAFADLEQAVGAGLIPGED